MGGKWLWIDSPKPI